jgi:hypothetical protein
MLLSFWRGLRSGNPGLPGGKSRRAVRHPSYPPRLEPLEDRMLPALAALLPAPTGAVATPSALSGLRPLSGTPATVTSGLTVTVTQNSGPTVIDLGPIFAAMSGLQHDDGLQLAMLGNTNPGLVGTDLSRTELTLTYTPGKSGAATITVGATDADGVSVRETLFVTVLPLPKPAATAGV